MAKWQNSRRTITVPCELCRRVRVVVVISMLFLGYLAAAGYLPIIAKVNLTAIAADLVCFTAAVMIVWKYYQEYWKPQYARSDDQE